MPNFMFAGIVPIWNLVESFVDNVFRDQVQPEIGSVVYCDLAFGYCEHSGIYIGGNQIVSLSRTGRIEVSTPQQFMDGGTAISIYVSCRGASAVGSWMAAHRAMGMIGETRDYNLLFDNCHQFTAGCLTGDFENSVNFLTLLKYTASTELDVSTWRVWGRIESMTSLRAS